MNQKVAITDELVKLEGKFEQQNAFGLAFKSECLFAKQQILKNDYTLSTATNNPGSLKNAILNVAAIGISLNPADAHAYLVPRGGQICLDISYRGLVKLATDSGAIEWAKAVLVYEGDNFKWRGPTEPPEHEADVFNPERIDAKDPLTNLKGGYCIAKLSGGGYMVEVMTAGEIQEVRNTSKAKDGPWKGPWAGEMAKKTIVKRAYKSWPESDGRERLNRAVATINLHEGLEDETPKHVADYLKHSPEQEQEFHRQLESADPLEFYIWYSGLDQRIQVSLVNSFTEQKGKGRELVTRLEKEGHSIFVDIQLSLTESAKAGDDAGVIELVEDMPEHHLSVLLERINDIEVSRFVEEAKAAA